MSRIGKQPIKIPDGVKVNNDGKVIKIEGSKGKTEHIVDSNFEYKNENSEITVLPLVSLEKNKALKSAYGMQRSILEGKITGVAVGYAKALILKGVGYRTTLAGNKLNLTLGFSHPVVFDLPEGIKATVDGQTKLVLESIDKQLVGETAAKIRSLRPPEPYKGKGIMYEGERIRRKAGKSAAGKGK
jgi:large subunit ribosomal protein L6